MLISIGTVINSRNIFADDIEKFANKLYSHYEYDDKITNYLKSFFSSSNSKESKILNSKQNFSRANTKNSNYSLKVKSKNKLIYSFSNGQSLQINPSNIKDKIIYNKTPNSYFEIKTNSVSYQLRVDF